MWDREDRSLAKISDILVQACCLCGQQERAVLFRAFLLCWAKFIRNVWWKVPMGMTWWRQIVNRGRHGWEEILSRDLCQQPSGWQLEMASKDFLYFECWRKFVEWHHCNAYKIQPPWLSVALATGGAEQNRLRRLCFAGWTRRVCLYSCGIFMLAFKWIQRAGQQWGTLYQLSSHIQMMQEIFLSEGSN